MKPVRIFVEGGSPKKKLVEHSTDSAFLRDCIKHWFNQKVDLPENFFYIGGASEFKDMAPDIRRGVEKGFEILLIIDADKQPDARKKEIEEFQSANGLTFPYFLFPDNASAGEVEHLLVQTATDKAKMDCYVDYEKCIGKELDIKDKVFAYIQATTGSKDAAKDQNRNFLNGFFNLDHDSLHPLKKFLTAYF